MALSRPGQALVVLSALLWMFGAPRVARAEPDLPDDTDVSLPCRPTIACTADLVRPGAVEVESGALYRRAGGPLHKGVWMFPVLAKLTVVEEFQLQLGSDGYSTTVSPPTERYIHSPKAWLAFDVGEELGMFPSTHPFATLWRRTGT